MCLLYKECLWPFYRHFYFGKKSHLCAKALSACEKWRVSFFLNSNLENWVSSGESPCLSYAVCVAQDSF